MNTHHNAVRCVFWQLEMFDSEVDVSSKTAHTNPASCVIATSFTDSINSYLVPLVESLELSFRAFVPIVTCMYLIEGLEDELVVIILELGSHLTPQGCNQFLSLLSIYRVDGSLTELILEGVVVSVQDDIETSPHSLVYYVSNLIEVVVRDNTILIHVVGPCSRDTNGLCTSRSQSVERCSAQGLYAVPIAPLHVARVEVVTEVPTPAQFLRHLCSSIAWQVLQFPCHYDILVVRLFL